MLIRVLRSLFSKKVGADRFTYKVSPSDPSHKQIQDLRNIDYPQKRRSIVTQFNTKITEERKIYQKELKQHHRRNISQEEGEKQFQRIIELYQDKIRKCSHQLTMNLLQIDKLQRQNTIKIYLSQNLKHEQTNNPPLISKQKGFYIPNRLVLKKLYLCPQKQRKNEDTSKQILLVGVQKEEQHCLFLNKLIDEFDVKNLVTMVAPDLPYFIKTQNSYIEEWKKFIQDPEYAKKTKFYVNPKPKKIKDICLNSIHFSLVKQALARSAAFMNTHYYLLKQNQLSGDFQPLPLLSGLCSQKLNKIYLGDYPIFQERKMLADNLELNHLRQLFQEFMRNFKKLKLNFSAQWLFPTQILRKKHSHIVKVTKEVARQSTGRTMLICPAQMAELIGIQWQLRNQNQNKASNQVFDFAQQVLTEDQTFMEHIQKLVILDLIMQPVITRYFARYKSFPFLCHHTIGGKENIGKIFIVWSHYYNMYHGQLKDKRLESKQHEAIRQAFMERYEDSTDFI